MVGVVEAGNTIGVDAGEDVGEDVVVFVKRYGTNPVVGGEAVGVSMGVDVGSRGIVDEYFALHLQYFFGGLVGAGNSGPSVGLLGGAIAMRTGLLRSCSASVVSVVSVAGFSPFLEEMTVVGLCPPGVLVVVACVVRR